MVGALSQQGQSHEKYTEQDLYPWIIRAILHSAQIGGWFDWLGGGDSPVSRTHLEPASTPATFTILFLLILYFLGQNPVLDSLCRCGLFPVHRIDPQLHGKLPLHSRSY